MQELQEATNSAVNPGFIDPGWFNWGYHLNNQRRHFCGGIRNQPTRIRMSKAMWNRAQRHAKRSGWTWPGPLAEGSLSSA
jgi:hypothetical protein